MCRAAPWAALRSVVLRRAGARATWSPVRAVPEHAHEFKEAGSRRGLPAVGVGQEQGAGSQRHEGPSEGEGRAHYLGVTGVHTRPNVPTCTLNGSSLLHPSESATNLKKNRHNGKRGIRNTKLTFTMSLVIKKSGGMRSGGNGNS